MTVNVAAAESDEAAQRFARPQLLAMVALRTGGTLGPGLTVEEAADVVLPPAHEELAGEMLRNWVIGTPESVAARLTELADTYEVDEVMINPIAGPSADDPIDRMPGRERTVELVAALLRTTWR